MPASGRSVVGEWWMLALGVVLGSWMPVTFVQALVRDHHDPNIGFGAVIFACIHPAAMVLTVFGALRFDRTSKGRAQHVGLLLTVLALAWMLFGLLGLGFAHDC